MINLTTAEHGGTSMACGTHEGCGVNCTCGCPYTGMEEQGRVELIAEARTTGQTGVEMEAMTACSVAALTVYDMVKGLERGVEVGQVVLLEKSGGRSDWRLDEGEGAPQP
jgi:molybdenum cofactor biosynthesis enzyme